MRNAAARASLLLAVLAVPAAGAEAPGTQRLGRDVVPVSQSIRLDTDARKAEYSGSVHIDLEVRRTAPSFALHALEMDLSRVALTGPAGEIATTHESGPRGRLEIRPAAPLAPGRYALEIDFANGYDTHATGLYKVTAGDESYVFSQFEADDARQAFPCFDEPSFKIPYQLTAIVPEGHLAVSNTPVESESTRDGRRTVVFARTKPLPSYLLALAAGPLETVAIPGMSVPGRVVTVKGASGMAGEAVRTTPKLLAALERYFGRPYPYEKLDLIAVPEFWPGAMENPGAITFRDTILLLDARGASVAQREAHVTINAHELAHMWFGDLVTMEWWDDLWLNESFASWMGDKASQEAFPEFATDVTDVADLQGAMVTDARLSTRAIRQPVTALDNLLQSADTLAYQKGEAVLAMVEAWVGPEAFRKGVLDYLAAHEWKNASAADLWRALGKAAGKDVGGTLATFLDQPGIPLVEVQAAGNRVTLSQRRFLNSGVEAPAAKWSIPVILRYEVGGAVKTRTVLLDGPSQSVALESAPGWLHPNADQRGYYRWSVPPALLTALAGRGRESMSVRERVGFVGNASALLDAGAVRGDQYLELIAPFAGDTAPEVVAAVVASLAKVKNAFVTAELRAPFAAYIRRVLGPALTRFGKERRAGEPDAVSLLRPPLLLWLGRDGEDTEALAHAESVARAFMAGEAADPSVVPVALQLHAIKGDRALFDEYRRRIETAKVPADRSRYLNALGYFRAPELVDAALAYVLDGPLRPQEIFAIPAAISTTVANDGRSYEFLVGHYPAISAKLPPMFLAFMPHAAGGCSVARAAKGKAFFTDPANAAPGMDKEIAKMTEAVKDCAALREREGAAVAAYLKKA